MPRPTVALPLARAAFLLLALGAAAQQQLPEDRRTGASTLTLPQLRQWLGTLASPEFEGRGTGQPGFVRAAEFVRDHFQALGLQPAGDDGSFFQGVPWRGAKVDVATTWVAFAQQGREVLRVPAARLGGEASADAAAAGRAVLLVVPPLAAADGELPEIKGLDQLELEGKVVVACLQPTADARAAGITRFQLQRQLQPKGVAALLLTAVDATTAGIGGGRGSSRSVDPAAAARSRMPAPVELGGDDLRQLLAKGEVDPKVLQGPLRAVELPFDVALQVKVEEQQLPACNVVAVLPGSDPQLRSEYVVVGSHLDHLGRRGNTIYPGADDDGSGTTGVMAVAQALAKNPVPPRRSVLFVCFCGEESGLVGSRYFVANSPIPLDSIAAELQMDMIGRDEESQRGEAERAEDNRNTLHLVGTAKISRDLHRLCLQRNTLAGFTLEWDEEGVFSRSDHASFAARGIPIAFFFTGFHKDYHRPSDTPDKIHYEKLLGVATYVYDLAFELAQQDQRPLVDEELWQQNRRSVRGVEVPAAPVRPAKGR